MRRKKPKKQKPKPTNQIPNPTSPQKKTKTQWMPTDQCPGHPKIPPIATNP